MDIRQQLMQGQGTLPCAGLVVPTDRAYPPFVVLDRAEVEIAAATEYLAELALGDSSSLTCRSYACDLLRWFRFLWVLDVDWAQATQSEMAVMVGWQRTAPNPQRRRRKPGSPAPGTVNLRTGIPALAAGYARTTINHALSVTVSGFYAHHGYFGHGPVINPVPVSPQRRAALAHRSPLEPTPQTRRARLRQRVVDRPPRAIPDPLWDALFEAMGCERDRALLEFFVSSGARATELLGVTPEDVDWARRQIYVISKGTGKREPIPASPQAFVRLARYLTEIGAPPPGQSIWRARRGPDRPMTYWALRRVLQHANDLLGTNWTMHDMRTAATRMANSGRLLLHEVQEILRHANIETTSRYVIFDEDIVHHYAAFLEERRRLRPTDEYRPLAAGEWNEFDEHFDTRSGPQGFHDERSEVTVSATGVSINIDYSASSMFY